MNSPYKYIDEPSDTPAKGADDRVINSDIFADRTPVDPALIHETPMGGTVASVGPLNEPVADEIQMLETPDQLIPMGGTVAAVDPENTGLRNDAVPLYETPVQQAPRVESVLGSSPVVHTELRDEAVPLYETPVKQAPLGLTQSLVHPMNPEMVEDSIPMYETPVKEISMIGREVVVDRVSDNLPYNAPASTDNPSTPPVLSDEESPEFSHPME